MTRRSTTVPLVTRPSTAVPFVTRRSTAVSLVTRPSSAILLVTRRPTAVPFVTRRYTAVPFVTGWWDNCCIRQIWWKRVFRLLGSLILLPFCVWNQCVPLKVLNERVFLYFFVFLLCNGARSPLGLVAPHQGVSCPTYGARRLFLIIILFDDWKN